MAWQNRRSVSWQWYNVLGVATISPAWSLGVRIRYDFPDSRRMEVCQFAIPNIGNKIFNHNKLENKQSGNVVAF